MLSCISSVQVLLFHTNFLQEPGFEDFGASNGVWVTGGIHNHHVRPGLTEFYLPFRCVSKQRQQGLLPPKVRVPVTRAVCLFSQKEMQNAPADMHNCRPAVGSGEASRAGTQSWRQARQPDALHAWQEITQHCRVPRRASAVVLDHGCLPECERQEDSRA